MKKIITAILLCIAASVSHAEVVQQIVNPFTKVGLWDLSNNGCYKANDMGAISVDGRFIGCWLKNNHPLANNEKEATFIIDGKVYSFPIAELNRDILNHNAFMESVAAQSLNATRSVRSQAPVYIAPSAPTYYYNSLGFPIGSSSPY